MAAEYAQATPAADTPITMLTKISALFLHAIAYLVHSEQSYRGSVTILQLYKCKAETTRLPILAHGQLMHRTSAAIYQLINRVPVP